MTLNNTSGDSDELEGSSIGEESASNTSQETEDILTTAALMAERKKAQAGSTKSKREERSRSNSPSVTEEEDDEEVDSESEASTSRNRSRSHSSSRRETRVRQGGVVTKLPTAETMTNAVINILSIATCLVIFGVFLVGSYDYFKNVEKNKCEMTYMYHVPQYVPLKVGSGLDEKYPMYHLYTYAEGERAFQEMSKESYRFKGIPILFIPGNAGSYQQVRSLASVALWKYIDNRTPFHFDFFTVDLNEEFSAVYGYTLQRQVEYTKQAVAKIVSLYEEFHRVILVGHSMGGVIAKAIALDEHGDSGASLVNFIITLATPHSNPVAILDPELDLFYHSVKKNWTKLLESETADASSSKATLVSIAGGDRDYLVQPKLTRWPPFTDILAITTGIPGVWASTDHLCIVWCKQLVITVVRAFYDLVEFQQRNKYYAITEDYGVRKAILDYHFVERASGKSYHTSPKKSSSVTLAKNADQIEVSTGLHCIPSGRRTSYVLYPASFLQQNTTSEDLETPQLIVMSTNTKDRNWLMGCVEFRGGLCLQAESLAHLGRIIPHIRRHRKMATIPLPSIISKYSHLVVKMDQYTVKTCTMLETYFESQRTFPLFASQLKTDRKIFYNLTLSRFTKAESTLGGLIFNLMAWKVEVRPESNQTCPESHNLLGTFGHGNFEQNRFFKNESLIVRHSDWNASLAWVALYLEPTCNYSVSVTLAPLETAGQFFKLVLRFLPSFFASVILMAFYYQKDPLNWSSFHLLLLGNAYHLSIFPGFCVAVALHLFPTDWGLMVEPAEYSVVLPIFLYTTAYSLVLGVSSATWYIIITGGTALHSIIIRVLSTRFGSWVPRLFSNHRGFTSVTEHVTEAAFEMTLTRFPLTIAVMLLALSLVTCGSFSIALCVVLYLVKLFKIYEDLLEDLLKAKIANVKDSLTPMNFHFSCFMLWLVIGALNVPSLLHWARSPSTGAAPQPQWDLSMYLCLLLLPTVAILWQDFVPKFEPNLWNVHRYVFYAMGMVCVLWGTHRLYVTAFLIVFVFLTMATCQLLSVMMSSLMREQPPASSSPPTSTPTSPLPDTEDAASAQNPAPSTSTSTAEAKEAPSSTASSDVTSILKQTLSSKEDLEVEPSS